jgi:hypothetical protein
MAILEADDAEEILGIARHNCQRNRTMVLCLMFILLDSLCYDEYAATHSCFPRPIHETKQLIRQLFLYTYIGSRMKIDLRQRTEERLRKEKLSFTSHLPRFLSLHPAAGLPADPTFSVSIQEPILHNHDRVYEVTFDRFRRHK